MIKCNSPKPELTAFEVLDKLYAVMEANEEFTLLEELMLRAELYWMCPDDGFTMWVDEDECACCGKPKP